MTEIQIKSKMKKSLFNSLEKLMKLLLSIYGISESRTLQYKQKEY